MGVVYACFIFSLSVGAHAATVNIDFSIYTPGSSLASADGVAFSLSGGPDGVGGSPTISTENVGAQRDAGLLTNSRFGGNTPTTTILEFTFDALASNVSFFYNNGGRGTASEIGDSYYEAFDEVGGLLETGSLNPVDPGDAHATLEHTLTASGIRSIQFNNASDGTESWWFGVASLSATTVPVPASVWLFGSGLLGLIGIAKRKAA